MENKIRDAERQMAAEGYALESRENFVGLMERFIPDVETDLDIPYIKNKPILHQFHRTDRTDRYRNKYYGDVRKVKIWADVLVFESTGKPGECATSRTIWKSTKYNHNFYMTNQNLKKAMKYVDHGFLIGKFTLHKFHDYWNIKFLGPL